MKFQTKSISVIIFILFVFLSSFTRAQITDRELPKEWDGLVFGGRFMDLFQPIPVNGQLTRDTWGGENVLPRYIDNGIEDREWSYWGGNAKLGDDGKFHLFVCRWKESSPRGHGEWPRSLVVHAVAENSFGPYNVKDEIGPGHNPEVFQLKDGRFVVYVIDGYYIADTYNGPWEYNKFEFNTRDRRIIEGLSNLTFTQREDGTFLMICRGGGVWFSETGISPYNQVTDERVYPPVEGRFEDPLVWRDNVQYHLIVNDWYGRIAWYLRSKDGINWKVDPGEAYKPGITIYEDGTVEDWFKYERIKVLQDKYGRATQAHFAVIDTLKKEDKANDRHSSKHICIPLTVGRLLTVLNKDKITQDTKTIKVKVEAEAGFNPETDIDLESLRFGAPEVVNFGKGSKIISAEKSGKDLILTFDGAGNGLTEDNFAAKLLGKTTDGKLLYGYSRLPGVEYIEPALSARLPVITKTAKGFDIAVEVQNFGQVTSKKSVVKIVYKLKDGDTIIAEGKIGVLKPFEKTTIKLFSKELKSTESKVAFEVIIESEGQKPVTLNGEVTIKE